MSGISLYLVAFILPPSFKIQGLLLIGVSVVMCSVWCLPNIAFSLPVDLGAPTCIWVI